MSKDHPYEVSPGFDFIPNEGVDLSKVAKAYEKAGEWKGGEADEAFFEREREAAMAELIAADPEGVVAKARKAFKEFQSVPRQKPTLSAPPR